MANESRRPTRLTSAPDPAAASPRARRLAGPRWLDLRLVVGVLLVLGSVLVGAKVISSADASTSVWAARSDLSAGTLLVEADLVKVRVQLRNSSARYLATTTSPAGRTLVKDIAAGELLPAASVVEASDYVTFSLAVPAQRVPVSLQRGQKVTIYASATDAASPPATTQVATGVTVLQISGRSDGALSVGTAQLQVVLSVRSCQVAEILDATERRTVSLAVLPASATVDPVDCPSTSASATPSSVAPAAPTS